MPTSPIRSEVVGIEVGPEVVLCSRGDVFLGSKDSADKEMAWRKSPNFSRMNGTEAGRRVRTRKLASGQNDVFKLLISLLLALSPNHCLLRICGPDV
jgi:hypothetical protein